MVDAETGHLQLHDRNFKSDYEPRFFLMHGAAILEEVKHIPEVRLSAPRSVTNGMLTTPTGSAGVRINGIIPALE